MIPTIDIPTVIVAVVVVIISIGLYMIWNGRGR